MTFSGQICAISTGASRADMLVVPLNRSLRLEGIDVNKNGEAACRSNLSYLPESIPVGKVARTVVIPSDMTKQMADETPEARYAFREWGREEVS